MMTGSKPQRLLLTLLGDYWHSRSELIPSAALVQLLADFDITETSARQAMRRLTERGMLAQGRVGRTTLYGIPQRIARVQTERMYRAMTFGQDHTGWDGKWTVVATTIPEKEREVRHQLRHRLRAMRFALLYDAVWVTPHDRADQAGRLLDELGVTSGGVMRADLLPRRSQDTPFRSIFGLDELAEEYRAFIRRHEGERDRLRRAEELTPHEALRVRTSLNSEWLSFRAVDPDLPVELLPQDWPRPTARALYLEVYDQVGPTALVRFREILGAVRPDLAQLAEYHTFSSAHGRTIP